MLISLSNFDMARLEEFKEAIDKHAKVNVRQIGEDVTVECEADMITCQKVVIISDLFWGGDEIGKAEKETI